MSGLASMMMRRETGDVNASSIMPELESLQPVSYNISNVSQIYQYSLPDWVRPINDFPRPVGCM